MTATSCVRRRHVGAPQQIIPVFFSLDDVANLVQCLARDIEPTQFAILPPIESLLVRILPYESR
jgi:hypothetical protein